jgi:hypothetical protein
MPYHFSPEKKKKNVERCAPRLLLICLAYPTFALTNEKHPPGSGAFIIIRVGKKAGARFHKN